MGELQEEGHVFSPDQASAGIPGTGGERHSVCLQRGSWILELYEPESEDRQRPHKQDECYVVLEGRGVFAMGEKRIPFSPGDLIFVPAGLPHRFEEFGERVRAWVIFAGPEGGDSG